MNREYILNVENLRTHFRTGAGIARAVDGVSFALRAGETFALVGESGSGKSVSALSILKLVPAPAGFHAGGHIRFGGQDIASLAPIAMRRIRGNKISMVFQEPMTALNPVFTVGDQVAEAVRLHRRVSRRQARALALEMFIHVGIPDPEQRLDNYPHQLSGGMRQRVMIAMALACRPAILVADEPTTALDVTIQAQILDLMHRLRDELGMAIVLITHDMGIVRHYADRVGVMYAGRIVEEATATTLFNDPRHPYTRLLLQSIPAGANAGRRLATIPGTVPPAVAFPAGCRFHNRCPFAFAPCQTEAPPDALCGAGHRLECHLAATGNPTPPLPVATAAPGDARICGQEPRLEVRQLCVHFPIRGGLLRRAAGAVRAVDGVELDIRRGETVALVGESGCGKTTVGKALIRLLDPTAGSITYHGTDLAALRGRALRPFRARIQMVFQDPQSSLDPRMTVGDSIREGMRCHGIARGREDAHIGALLQKVGLDPQMQRRYPHEFSGGQRQRIGIARALAVEPELIICDEATSSLDVSVQAQILNLLQDIQASTDLSFLFITHDLGVVRHLADRVYVMYLGRIVETATTTELFSAPRHPYTRALLAAVPRIGADARPPAPAGSGEIPSPIRPPAGCHFHPRCPHADDRCRAEYPAAATISRTHLCRCHRHEALPVPSR